MDLFQLWIIRGSVTCGDSSVTETNSLYFTGKDLALRKCSYLKTLPVSLNYTVCVLNKKVTEYTCSGSDFQDVTFLYFRLVSRRVTLNPSLVINPPPPQYFWTQSTFDITSDRVISNASLFLEEVSSNFGYTYQLLDTSERNDSGHHLRRMSDFDSNPFADPDFSNPFQVTLAS